MLKKRLIFTLLYSDGSFMLSRNFRLQKVGNLAWLQSNFHFSEFSQSIDELVVLDVTRGNRDREHFCQTIKALTESCFIPIAAGGGVETIENASELLRSGADKIVINSSLFREGEFIEDLASHFGQQCLLAAMDIKLGPDGSYNVWSMNGSKCLDGAAAEWVAKIANLNIGELYINSMDRDGTGLGLDLGLLSILPKKILKPIIFAGGVGHASHLVQGLKEPQIDAVATANLFNFLGDGLKKAREFVSQRGVFLPSWDIDHLARILNNKKVVR